MRARRGAAIAGAVYLTTLLVVPLIARETDVLRAHPEHYTTGVPGVLVRVGYGAVAFMALAIAASVLRWSGWLGRIAAALLAVGGVTSVMLAAMPQEVTGGPLLFGVLALALAPVLVSISGAGRLPPGVIALGVMVTIGFVGLIVLAPRDLAGIANRSWDVLLAVWGLSFAIALRPVRDVKRGGGTT